MTARRRKPTPTPTPSRDEIANALRDGEIISSERATGSTQGAGAIITDPAKLRAFTEALDNGATFEEAMLRFGPGPGEEWEP